MGRVSEEGGATAYRRYDCTDSDPVVVEEAAEAARQAVERGECIVLPTDTVYGIGADAFSGEAVQRLLDAKGRGRDMPPPVLVADASLLRALTVDVPQAARDLVLRHWPGPLTIICRAQPSLRMDLGDAEGTIALRVPDHALARDVLRRTGPMAVSSANLSGRRAATTCDQAVEQLGDRVTVYLDGGARPWHGEPSTIVDFSSTADGVVLRKGALSVAAIREICPLVVDPDEVPPDVDADKPSGPGSEGPGSDGLDSPRGDSEAVQPAPTWSKDAGYAGTSSIDEPSRGPAVARPAEFHEPTTDELGITHSLDDPDQPSLFDPSESDGGADQRDARPDAEVMIDDSSRTES
jgi:L-threonylcarbamoyladenylate synthase